MRLSNLPLLSLAISAVSTLAAQCDPTLKEKPRVFIFTDILNEPDDSQSLIRLLLHADELDIQGLVATTSYWLNTTNHPDELRSVLETYGDVVDNLQLHAPGKYPSAEDLLSKVASGPTVYGSGGIGIGAGGGNISTGAALFIDAVDSSSRSRPLWAKAWGGVNTLGEALYHIQSTRSASELSEFISKVRVYTISDQDDVGTMIRRDFPQMQYICSIHGWNEYSMAAWIGISDISIDVGGADSSLVSPEWIKENVQLGPLGKLYPDTVYNMEGDTPSLLYSIPNGLSDPEHPEWGNWGGRYMPSDHTLKSAHYGDARDEVIGEDGKTYTSNHASVWRWRQAFQYEIAARIQWQVKDRYEDASHPPVVQVNASCDLRPLEVDVKAGSVVFLDGSMSYDRNTNDSLPLTFDWWQYEEPTASQLSRLDAQKLEITRPSDDVRNQTAEVQIPLIDSVCVSDSACQDYHLILEVTGSGGMPMTRYKRVVLRTHP
ncbi:hypothetical protein FQN54_000448 [Arachnomyces sp. PD_36]|nr:hypothetical protein FQN54_000448 [Arachnomyces sp. PD_36]